MAAAIKVIEYWGMDTNDCKIGMLLKQKLYQQQGKRLIPLYPADLPLLDTKLAGELKAMADIEQTRSQK